MELDALIRIANQYHAMGRSAQAQLDALLQGEYAPHTAHALGQIAAWLVQVERLRGDDAALQQDIDLLRDDLAEAYKHV